jgi:Tfp pilus assembly protein PilF
MRVRLAVALALHDLHDPRGDEGLRKLADDPTSSSLVIPHLELAGNAMPQKDWKTAQRELKWVVKLWPFYADAIFQLAAVEHELGDDAAATARVDQALRLEPTHQGALGLKSILKP